MYCYHRAPSLLQHTMKLPSHFTTAGFVHAGALSRVSVGLVALALYGSGHAFAQTDAVGCTDGFGLQPSAVQLHQEPAFGGQWWFEPANTSPSSLPTALALQPADSERFLGANNDSVLIRWRAASDDMLRRAANESYFVVRAGEPIRDMSGQTVGRFVRLIAKARWDTRILVDQPPSASAVREFIAPLRLTQTVEEVERNDQVLPRSCIQLSAPNARTPSDRLPIDVLPQPAHVLGFLTTHKAQLMGAHNSIALMDQGAEHGVTPQQRWAVVETLNANGKSNELSQVSRQRAAVRIVQVLPRYSIVQIQNTEREVLRGAYLKRLPEANEGRAP